LQDKALQYLGVHGNRENRALLAEIYASSSDVAVKRRILRSFMVAGERDRLLTAAREEKDVNLRGEAVRQLGVMSATTELWQLYQAEPTMDVKRQIIQAFFVGGGADRILEIARTEKDPDLRRRAVRNLGLMGADRTGEALSSLYANETDATIRKEVIQAFFLQNNARTLVALARKETDAALKREIVSKLSIMKSPDATEYLMELLK
jgi:HEAT repeat protein